jgi:hypothetical protein
MNMKKILHFFKHHREIAADPTENESETFILTKDEKALVNGAVREVKAGKKYIASTEVTGIKGDPFSACFGVITLNEQEKEVKRQIRFLDNFSGTKQSIKLPFHASTNHILLMYRINTETPTTSNIKLNLLPIDKIKIAVGGQEDNLMDSFDPKLTSAWLKFGDINIHSPEPISSMSNRVDVSSRISFMDVMYTTDPIRYFKAGKEVIKLIESALRLIGNAVDIKKILDMACGHGRILRYLKAYFPGAQITA